MSQMISQFYEILWCFPRLCLVQLGPCRMIAGQSFRGVHFSPAGGQSDRIFSIKSEDSNCGDLLLNYRCQIVDGELCHGQEIVHRGRETTGSDQVQIDGETRREDGDEVVEEILLGQGNLLRVEEAPIHGQGELLHVEPRITGHVEDLLWLALRQTKLDKPTQLVSIFTQNQLMETWKTGL